MFRTISHWLNAAPARTFEFSMIFLCLFFAKPTPTSCAYGFTISLIGLILKLWSSGYKRPKKSVDTSGPYAYVRHPKSLGTFLLILGLSIAGYSFYFLIFFLVCSVFVFGNRIHIEEQRGQFSQNPTYKAYRAFVPRFFPAIKSYREPIAPAATFSLRYSFLVRRNRELEGIIIFIIAYSAMISLQVFKYHQSWKLAIVVGAAIMVTIGFLSHRARRTV